MKKQPELNLPHIAGMIQGAWHIADEHQLPQIQQSLEDLSKENPTEEDIAKEGTQFLSSLTAAMGVSEGELTDFDERSYLSFRMGNIAVIYVRGVIIPYTNRPWYCYYGYVPLNILTKEMERIAEDSDIDTVIHVYDTPGGSAQQLTDMVTYMQKFPKPIYGYVSGFAASAGYFMASNCKKLFSSEMGRVGSIGTIISFMNWDKYYEQQGIQRVKIVSKQSPHKDMTDPKNLKYLQEEADDLTEIFVSHVAKGRHTTPEDVLENFGKGRVFLAAKALDIGMIDKIGTLSSVLQKYIRNEEEVETSASSLIFSQVSSMEPKTIQEKHPASYQAILDLGKSEGIKMEQSRVSSLESLFKQTGNLSVAAQKAARGVIDNAIESGATAEQTSAEMWKATAMAPTTETEQEIPSTQPTQQQQQVTTVAQSREALNTVASTIPTTGSQSTPVTTPLQGEQDQGISANKFMAAAQRLTSNDQGGN